MGGLLSSLHFASSALAAFSQALGAEQGNIANASTPGYVARTVTTLPIGPSGNGQAVSGSPFGDSIQLSSPNTAFADAAVRSASTDASSSQTTAQQLSPINQLFDITGQTGILAAFQKFGTAFSSLSANPGDPSLGAAALTAASNVALAFNNAAASLGSQRTQLDANVQSTVSQINDLAQQIGRLNVQTAAQSPPNPATDASLRSSLDQLSSLVDVTVSTGSDGSVTVLAGGQLPLVIGDQAYKLSANPAAAPGSQVSSTGGGNSPLAFSGQLGSLLAVRSGALASLLGSGGNPGTLNQLASGFASRVNALLTSGVNASGAAGAPLFSWDGANPQNAAATLAANPAVTASQLGLASTGAAGTANGIANQLAALPGSTATADQIAGLSPQAFFASMAAAVGQQLSDANTASTAAQTALTAAQSSRQQQFGVSFDREAVNITADQRAYEANAQVVSILNQLSQTTMDLVK